MLNIVMFNVVLLNSSFLIDCYNQCHCAECHYAECLITLNVPEPSICPSMRLRESCKYKQLGQLL
jgi:hypothetical protein